MGGDVICGDIGCDTLKRYSFIGEAATWVHACERHDAEAGGGVGAATVPLCCAVTDGAKIPHGDVLAQDIEQAAVGGTWRAVVVDEPCQRVRR